MILHKKKNFIPFFIPNQIRAIPTAVISAVWRCFHSMATTNKSTGASFDDTPVDFPFFSTSCA